MIGKLIALPTNEPNIGADFEGKDLGRDGKLYLVLLRELCCRSYIYSRCVPPLTCGVRYQWHPREIYFEVDPTVREDPETVLGYATGF
jgi:hypothetical protein